MKRRWIWGGMYRQRVFALAWSSVLIYVLAACSATAPRSGDAGSGAGTTGETVMAQPTPESTVSPSQTDEPIDAPTVAPEDAAAPVTASMQQLELTGEAYSALGDPDAPLTMIEFSDYGCPFCRRYASDTFATLKAEYIDTGKVYYVFKDYPIVQLHPQAQIAAQAAECAGAQDKYWEMHEALFAMPNEWDTTEDTAHTAFTRYAQAIGLDKAAFAACMEVSGRAYTNVEANVIEGRQLGITSTPSFVINGKLLAGAHALDVFQRVLDRELKALDE